MRLSPPARRSLSQALCLVLLLLAGQQGGVVHELGHVADAQGAGPGAVVAAASIDGSCMLCPLFAQATAAGFSHSLPIPASPGSASTPIVERECRAVECPVPTPRSRGPPSLS